MKICLVFMCVILAVFAIANADVCNYKGRSLKVGESYQEPGTCSLKKCDGPNKISSQTCPDLTSLDSHKHVPDLSKPYPQCC